MVGVVEWEGAQHGLDLCQLHAHCLPAALPSGLVQEDMSEPPSQWPRGPVTVSSTLDSKLKGSKASISEENI
jgi:hypothetical protein